MVGGRGEGAISTWSPLLTIRQPFHLRRLYNILPNHSAFFSSPLTISKLLRTQLTPQVIIQDIISHYRYSESDSVGLLTMIICSVV